MTKYLLRFTPMAPFFFGNERGLYFPGSNSQYQKLYFVRSENSPSQTTVLGALRFLLLQANGRKANEHKELTDKEKILVGEESFDAEKDVQSFGAISSISPVFLMKDGVCYIPAPMDHNAAHDDKYTPLQKYKKALSLEDDDILYAEDYDSKCGVVSGYVSLKDGEVLKNDEENDKLENDKLFSPVLRVGVNRSQQGKDEGGFFKREYKRLKHGFCFAVYCELDESKMGNIPKIADNNIPKIPKIAYLGQGHTPFRVDIELPTEETTLVKEVGDFLEKRHDSFEHDLEGQKPFMIYCLGDAFMTSDSSGDLYENLLFGVTESRDFRSLSTKLTGERLHLNKSGSLYHLMKAGSVLIAPSEEVADKWIDRFRHKNASNIGFNAWIVFPLGNKETK